MYTIIYTIFQFRSHIGSIQMRKRQCTASVTIMKKQAINIPFVIQSLHAQTFLARHSPRLCERAITFLM